MRIRTKITALVAGVLLASFTVCGAFAVNQFMNASVERLAENEAEKLAVSGWAFGQVGTREDLEQMVEQARDAYLKFQFERCYQKGYALMKGEECIKNLTDYDIINPSALTDGYSIQKIEERWLLIMKSQLEYPSDFWVMAVKDITGAWTQAREQVVRYLVVFACTFAVAMTVLAVFIRRMLRVLERLQGQAEAISRGDFTQKVHVDTGDELAELSGTINSMSDRIEQQIEDLQLLLGALAHETKTPVTNIIGYADSLLHVRLNERQKEEALEAIYRSAWRLDQLSGKLMQLIGLYENQELEMEALSVGEVLKLACAQLQGQLGNGEIRLSLELEQPDGFWVMGDRLLLGSLFDNLLNNARKALEQGGEIRVVCTKNAVQIRDNGCGIPEADIPHVRKAFYMADKSRSRRQQGAGLGLALVERIALVHQAVLEIESSVGAGTCMTVTFSETFTNQT